MVSRERRDWKRIQKPRKQNIIVLIVVPGPSERDYFTGMSDRFKSVKIIINDRIGDSNPIETVKKAKRLTINLAGQKTNPDFLYVVLDYDNEDKIDALKDVRFNDACKKKSKERFKVFYSNPCFEVWLKMHFECVTAFTERNKVQRWAETNINGYRKGKDRLLYQKIKDREATGITNAEIAEIAEKLHDKNNTSKPSERNPSSTMHKLIESVGTI